MSKREQALRSSSANECPAGILNTEGILLDAPVNLFHNEILLQ